MQAVRPLRLRRHMTIPAREGDRCTVCGTPLEPVELSGTPLDAADEFVLRCANGHEHRVVRHESADDSGSDASATHGAAGSADDDASAP